MACFFSRIHQLSRNSEIAFEVGAERIMEESDRRWPVKYADDNRAE